MATQENHQNVVVMRHGDRLDNFEELWVMKADRPWDPPLHQDGKIRAFCTGQKIRSSNDFPIHRVFVSPFLRCVQTAAEVVRALCDVADHSGESNTLSSNSDSVIIDPSKVKVHFLSFYLSFYRIPKLQLDFCVYEFWILKRSNLLTSGYILIFKYEQY